MDRYLAKSLETDLARKMVFLSGPRQAGKTYLSKMLIEKAGFSEEDRYFSWDAPSDQKKILNEVFPTPPGIIVLDEIHKYARWRNLLKGIYDKRGSHLKILVTGSAKLDVYRKGGDSLQGRYFRYRLHPLSLAEVAKDQKTDVLADLLRFGGFPEPYLLRSERESSRWSEAYRSRLVRDDLANLERVSDISLVEQLSIRLPDLVGSPLSLNNLKEDLQVAHQTVARWVQILENLYAIFFVLPFGPPKIRAVKKERKHYHFDWTLVEDPALRFENLIASHLLKWCHFQEDVEGKIMELRYFRDTDKREVDFVILEKRKPIYFIEVKLSDTTPSPALQYLHKKFPLVPAMQLVMDKGIDETTREGIRVCDARIFLQTLV